MKKIELTEQQIEVIKLQLAGEIEIATATEQQQKDLTSVIDMADEYIEEVDGYDDMLENYDADMIKWFYGKYQEQQNA